MLKCVNKGRCEERDLRRAWKLTVCNPKGMNQLIVTKVILKQI